MTKATLCEFSDIRLPREVQLRRMERVIAQELTACQREILTAVYFGGKTQTQLAAERGVSRSSICRTLARAQERLQRYLRY